MPFPRTPGTPGTAGEGRTPLPSPSLEAAAATATIRWAGSRVDVAPLSLPSPEHELMDPLRGFTVSIPGTHDQPLPSLRGSPIIPRVAPKGSFWEGTQDVYTLDGQKAPHPPENAPVPVPPTPGSSAPAASFRTVPRRAPIPPATAPIPHSRVVEAAGDYFSDARNVHQHAHAASRLRNAISPSNSSEGSGGPEAGSGGASSAPAITGTPPPLQRRLTDPEHVAFLDEAANAQRTSPSTNDPAQSQSATYAALSLAVVPGLDRRTKEEREYTALGFLVPPQPPDEEERRKALYRFNVMHTARDVNFDRIAHLSKLVFKTKMVYISLVDAAEQWFKAESGLGVPSVARDVSFCGHCILQRGDEPMIVLDATRDWRFQRNPLVMGPPHIRFYAGAPLRTHDGHNIGSLCVIDDVPWTEFTPRQRHTLKEFAAIVMRELELWRDKIQLRIRDRIQTSMEHFTRECLEMDTNEPDSMNRVYDRAAKLVKRTLDVEGALVLDISHLELMEITDDNGKPSILFHGDPYGPTSAPTSSSAPNPPVPGAPNGTQANQTLLHRKYEFGSIPPLPVLGSAETAVDPDQRARGLTAIEHAKLSDFLVNYPDGKIYEGLVPLCFRHMLPNNIQYAMIVPVWSIDKNCFVLLLAYTTDLSKHYLEGYELQYLRAIGVIILSSMLKRRMQLADKAKSHFISNISHELRTPLHGILAAAELLGDTRLSGTQSSFLHTVQACATSLVETVNHVLDFTKLSGAKNAHAQPEQPIRHGHMDLITLVEETTENCFIGQQARAMGEIGSVYAPSALAEDDSTPAALTKRKWARVETVVDIGLRKKGWNVLIERGGIRRVLTNLIGNSLKFTSDGFVQVSLRESQEPAGRGMIRVELLVTDTGKGISKDFLKNQLFHPFSQENPMQSGTGLGLAIVNSIVRSESVNGKVDVWSVEGQGTEIKVSFDAEVLPADDSRCGENPAAELDVLGSASVSLIGFDQEHRGQALVREVIKTYLRDWWDFDVKDENDLGNILIVNEDFLFVRELVRQRDVGRPVILLSAVRGDQKVSAVCDAYERMGGLIAVVFKPGGPTRLLKALRLCLNDLDIRRRGQVPRSTSENLIHTVQSMPVESRDFAAVLGSSSPLRIRPPGSATRPNFARSRTDSGDLRLEGRPPPPPLRPESSLSDEDKYIPGPLGQHEDEPTAESPGSPQSMVSIGNGGVMVRSAVTSATSMRKARVLVIEDNPINRRVLGSYLSKRGHQYFEAFDGQDGVDRFNIQPVWFFDVILVDMSMPRLDGVETTTEIRHIETERRRSSSEGAGKASTIFALTGLATAEDKRRAFNAGVDGYLVKPVSLKSLDEVFSNLGFA
ncbi:hypothetical protein CALVIDRAFT_521478 [Calocera viscosa TUFC12733]|uniref:histidine kinase n=1 Tax=Calocera viscosa (strain TUFC12733) TaxID=1330018 RepID=A0A167HFJ6_CALVF|nr:hypothetical protein CALVIDRAFT_521478 [Calocera viscosa TUFC12733]